MDSLPASALKVVGQYLDPQDAVSCRSAARCLAPVIATQLSTSQIRVVATSFQLQLQQEENTRSSTSSRTAATGTAGTAATARSASVDPPTQRLAQLLIASKDTHCPSAPTAAATAAEGGDDTSSPTLRSRTAASLARAAAAGYSKATVFVDVQQQYVEQTWQELFGALLSSSSRIAALTIVEYSSNSLGLKAKKIMERRASGKRTDMGPAATVGAAAAAAKASTAGSSSWLLPLVSAYTTAGPIPALVHLELQLPEPLELYVQPFLLQLTGLKTLALHPTRIWPQSPPGRDHLGPCEPVLRPCVVQGLTQLSNLQSLTCCVAASRSLVQNAEVAVMLQRTFSNLGRQVTHLSFGRPRLSVQIQLSTPLVSMYDLRSLICQPGFTLDSDVALVSLSDHSTAAGSSSSNSPRFQIAPSLTKLVLNESANYNSLLKVLVGKGISNIAAAAARPRTQLVHLELNSRLEVPVEILSQLAGLRCLKTIVKDERYLTLLSQSPLASQLQGLTLLCKQPGDEHDEWGFKWRPVQPVIAFTGLHSLAIIGTEHSVQMDAVLDLHLLCNLKNLQHLNIQCPSMDDLPEYLASCIAKLPSALQSLSLDPSGRPRDLFDTSHLKFSTAAFSATLTSLKFKEVFVEEVDPDEMESVDTASSARTDSASPTVRNPLREAAAAALLKDNVRSELSGVGDSRSSSNHHNGLAGLLELSAEFYATSHATKFLRHCPSLQKLDLRIPYRYDLQRRTDDPDACANSAPLQLSRWCPQLRTLRLVLTVDNPWDSCSSWTAVDELFDIVWPGVTDISGLQSLTLSTPGSLSYNKIVPCLSSLSDLARLRDLSLQFKLDITDADCLDGQQQENEQAQHATSITILQSETEQLTRVHRGSRICGPLFSAMQGCIGLRQLVLDVPIVATKTTDFYCFPGSLVAAYNAELCFGETSTVVQLQQRLQNCLVLGRDYHVHQSSSSMYM